MSYLKRAEISNRAYSVVNFKASARDDGTIVGIASTIETDRAGDVLMPTGSKFRLPIPLLWQHDASNPIGHVTSAKVTSRGIEIVGKIAVGATDQIDRAYKLVRAGLVQGLSVGFRPLETPEVMKTGGLLYRSWEIYEISCVTIPCNASATITSVKSVCGVSSVHNFIPLTSTRAGTIPLISGAVSLRSGRAGTVSLRSVGDGSIKLPSAAERQMNRFGIRLIGSR